MALTNFAALPIETYQVWARDTWKVARNNSFINQFAGTGSNAMVQKITELTKNQKGARAVMTLVPDLVDDGVVGDNTLEGNEEQIMAHDQVIKIDQLRHANRLAGRMADQKTVIDFRKNSRDVLGYWLADRMDQLAFLTLSGMAYTNKNNGGTRVGSNLPSLEYAADVAAPTSDRVVRWDEGTKSLMTDGTGNLAAEDKLTYKALVEAKAFAKENYIKGIKTGNGEEVYHVFVTPTGMKSLKLDQDYLNNVRSAGVRGGKNPLFAGTTSVMVDGLIIHEYRHVYNNAKAGAGNMWGGAGNVAGQRVLLCGAQALGFADIGAPMWVEDDFDYENQNGISVSKIFGFLKPKFHSNYSGNVQDFGVLCIDTAL